MKRYCAVYPVDLFAVHIQRRPKGFSLFWLILALLILGAVSALTVPNFIHQNDDEMLTKHRAIAASFKLALSFSHRMWRLEGSVPNAVNVKVFEDAPDAGRLAYSATGWPIAPLGRTDLIHHNCSRVFKIFSSGIESNQIDTRDIAYDAERLRTSEPSEQGCVYTLKQEPRLSFRYSSIDGKVLIDDVLE